MTILTTRAAELVISLSDSTPGRAARRVEQAAADLSREFKQAVLQETIWLALAAALGPKRQPARGHSRSLALPTLRAADREPTQAQRHLPALSSNQRRPHPPPDPSASLPRMRQGRAVQPALLAPLSAPLAGR